MLKKKKTLTRTTRSGDLEGKVFNKLTGEVITNMQLMELLKEKPGLKMELFFDRYGELEKSIYDPSNPFKHYNRDPEKQPKRSETFPEFSFNSVDGDEFVSEELIGKWVLIQFNPFPDFMDKNQWTNLVSDLRKSRKEYEIECIGVFSYDDDLGALVEEFQPDIKLVNNGNGFFSRYHIIQIPTTVLIDPSGVLVTYFYGNDPIDFLPFLK